MEIKIWERYNCRLWFNDEVVTCKIIKKDNTMFSEWYLCEYKSDSGKLYCERIERKDILYKFNSNM